MPSRAPGTQGREVNGSESCSQVKGRDTEGPETSKRRVGSRLSEVDAVTYIPLPHPSRQTAHWKFLKPRAWCRHLACRCRQHPEGPASLQQHPLASHKIRSSQLTAWASPASGGFCFPGSLSLSHPRSPVFLHQLDKQLPWAQPSLTLCH